MPATFLASSRVRAANGSRLWNWYLLALMMTRSASISRTIASEDSKKPRSKPSCTSINSTAKPIPALDRTSRRLLAKRLRRASGTRRPPATLAIVSDVLRIAPSEDFRRVGPPQAAERQKRRDRRHQQRDPEHRAQLGRAQGERQQGLAADLRIDEERRPEGGHKCHRHDQERLDHHDRVEIAVGIADRLEGGELRQLPSGLGRHRPVQ